jgi:chloramphenicol 3-O-phosphotransferase
MRTVFVVGTVGVGKTTTAAALSDLLTEDGVLHAVIDTDEIRRLRPPPVGDPFQLEVQLANLAAIAANYRAAGARVLIAAGVIESREDLARCMAAVDGPAVVIRLTADADVIGSRLDGRHADDAAGLAWHAHRAVELDRILDAAALPGTGIETTDRTPREVAQLIRTVL